MVLCDHWFGHDWHQNLVICCGGKVVTLSPVYFVPYGSCFSPTWDMGYCSDLATTSGKMVLRYLVCLWWETETNRFSMSRMNASTLVICVSVYHYTEYHALLTLFSLDIEFLSKVISFQYVVSTQYCKYYLKY